MSGTILNIFIPVHYQALLRQGGADVNPTKLVRCVVRYLTEHWPECGRKVANGEITPTQSVRATVRITGEETDALAAVLGTTSGAPYLSEVVRRALYLTQLSAEDLDRYLPDITRRVSRVRATARTPSTASGALSGHWWWLTDALDILASRREAPPFTLLPSSAGEGRRIIGWTCDPAQVAAFLEGRPLDEAKITRAWSDTGQKSRT